MLQLDHIMYAVPDLSAGIDDMAAKLGARPVYGGAHPGRGTHNALLSLGSGQYLEIIAPDPNQAGTAGEQAGTITDLRNLDGPQIKTWAVATDNFERLHQICAEQGLAFNRLVMSRATPAGPTLNWELLFVSGHGFGDLFPFFIDWLESPHPSATNPHGGSLESFTVETSDAPRYSALMSAFSIDSIQVVPGADRLHATIRGRQGELVELQVP